MKRIGSTSQPISWWCCIYYCVAVDDRWSSLSSFLSKKKKDTTKETNTKFPRTNHNTKVESQWIVAQRLLSTLTIPWCF